jgi:N-sulfoglucosamine sulfohydrolase
VTTTSSRRKFLKTLCAGTTGLVFAGKLSAGGAVKPKRPNILWIVAEDMNPWMSCYGDKLLTTPTFDQMGARGVRFNRAYVPAPVCSPCRSAIITGAMQTTLGIHNHRSSRSNARNAEHKGLGMIHLPKGVKTVPELFAQAGYCTFNQGKTDYNFVYSGDKLYNVKNWKQAVAQGKPWFGQIQLKGGKNGKASLPASDKSPVAPSQVTIPPYYPDHPDFRKAYADHYACVLGTDVSVKKILDELAADGLTDNTVVFFFSDHGAPPLLRHKQFCYEGGIRVPLLVQWPGNPKAIRANGPVRDDLVSGIDISVSSLAIAGIDPPPHMEGRNLFAPDHKPRQYVISARDRCDFTIERIRAVVTKRYKYLRNFLTDRPYLQPQYRDGQTLMKTWKKLRDEGKLTNAAARFISNERPAEEFYDLNADPHELNNLANDPKHAAELKRHRDILTAWMKSTDDKGQYPESPEGLLQVLYRWGKRCENPEYEVARKKYGKITQKPKKTKKPKTPRKNRKRAGKTDKSR